MTKRLVFWNTFVFAVIAGMLYLIIPYVLNYPANSIDNQFQVELVGIKYTHQFIILMTVLIVLVYIIINMIFKRLANIDLNDTQKVLSLRRRSFNYPFLLLLAECCAPTVIVGIMLKVFNTEFELLVRLCTVVFSFSAIFAIVSYMLNKKFFLDKLILTSKAQNIANGMKINIMQKLVLQILPLFLCSFVILLLFSIANITTQKGDLLYHFYRQELLSRFNENKEYSINEISDLLKSIELNSEKDSTFVLKHDGEVLSGEDNVNEFLKKYTLDFYEETSGHSYEYYGQNISSAVIKTNIESEGECYIGIRYYVFADNFIMLFIGIAIILSIFDILFILYIGKNISNDIKIVTEGLDTIAHSENIVHADYLPLTSTDEIGDLTSSFNNVQNLTKNYVDQIHEKQDMLMEKERLASLGQLIGGIAHNLKTPIMSIAGAAEGINDLIKEYDSSIENPSVNAEDHHDIAKDMSVWVNKIKEYTEYMSDVITAVKGQAIALSNDKDVSFTIEELLKKVNILMKHELKNAIIYLNTKVEVDENTSLNGDVNSLVQVINNMISNSIQAYAGSREENIDLIIEKSEDNNLVISIRDYASGMTPEVRDKLFKEMITTKGKNGTGLGLFMSYSNIRAHFNGTITVESELGEGTVFHIIIPLS